MTNVECDEKFEWLHKFPRTPKPEKTEISKLFDLVPHRGVLKPNESQYVHVIFTPPKNINVKATLECHILGGPTESVIVLGQSSDLKYALNAEKIHFKIRSFHENATEELMMINTAFLPFEYATYLKDKDFKSNIEAVVAEISPSNKILQPNEEVVIKVLLKPGIVGYFNRMFYLEIGYLHHIPIEIDGWGVIPQVYLSLPRLNLPDTPPELGYTAISLITVEFLEGINEILSKSNVANTASEESFGDLENIDEWHICSVWDGCPTVMDVELAFERLLVIEYIQSNPGVLARYSENKMGPIAGFFTLPYIIDYGVVIIGTSVHCSVQVVNYSPITLKFHPSKSNVIPRWLNLKLCGKMAPGERTHFEISFTPTVFDFEQLDEDVEARFYLEVPYGVTIPIVVRATCAVPYLLTNASTINFGSVRCGDKIVCSIPLKNVGKSTCIWFVTLKMKVHRGNPISVLNGAGKYEPGEGGWLNIAFKPSMEMTYEGLLIFRFHMNPRKMTIPITGNGIVPRVQIIGPNVVFPPTLPWAETTDMFFGLTNPCPFPVELIIPHVDEKWKEEEDIYQLLHKYYDKPDEMLVPAVKPGLGLPAELLKFYNDLRERVRKGLEEDASEAGSSRTQTTQRKPKKPPPRASMSKFAQKETPAQRCRTEAEILSDELKSLKESGADPLKNAINALEKKESINKSEKSKGVIIITHGSPCVEMQCKELSFSVGKKLNLPVINVDECTVDALCLSECAAKYALLETLEVMYELATRMTKTTSKTKHVAEPEPEGSLDNEMGEEPEDNRLVFLKKLEVISTCKNLITPRSKASDKKKGKASSVSLTSRSGVAGSSTAILPTELLVELLTDYFNHEAFAFGFVVDTLNSFIFKTPILTLTSVLKSKHKIQTIHMLLCHLEFAKWEQMFSAQEKEAFTQTEIKFSRVFDETEIQDLINVFDEMSASDYENSSPDLKSVFVTHGLHTRRENYLQKRSPLQKNVRDYSARVLPRLELSEEKKKTKKEDTLTLTLSSGKKSDKTASAKPNSQHLLMITKYNEYQKLIESLISAANNWVLETGDIAYPLMTLSGFSAGISSRSKTKKKSDIAMEVSDTVTEERGFPLTIVMCGCLTYKEAIITMLLNCPFISEALRKEPEVDILKLPINCKEYTELLPKVYPSMQHEESLLWKNLDELPIKKCECNQLTDIHLVDDSTQDNVLNILSKWHCTCGKKVTSSSTSTTAVPLVSLEKILEDPSSLIDIYPQPLPLHGVACKPTQADRLVLEPGDLVRFKYSYSPQVEGQFAIKRYVEVGGWPESRDVINISAICDLPRLDSRPKKIFDNFVRRTVEENVYKLSFLNEKKSFEFGPIFIGENRVYEENYNFNMKNASLITAIVSFELLQDTPIFLIEKESMLLEPGCRDKLQVLAAPTIIGEFTNTLLCSVKDNPEIVMLSLSCTGVVPFVDILPVSKIIDYGRQLLYRREDDRFIVKNDSILPIMWKIRNSEDFLEDFIISQTSGIVQRYDNQVVPVTYIACKVGVITNKQLLIDIYDAEGRGTPMISYILNMSAECYDVMVDCAFEDPSEMCLNFGNVKVNSTLYQDMFLLNRGKYNTFFKLKKVKNFPEPSLLRSMEVSQESGLVPPTMKMVTIEFTCTPDTYMNLNNVPAFICSLLDANKEQVVVAKFPICVTLNSYYNTFTLFPFGELNFHVVPPGLLMTKEIIINNTSKTPISYTIKLPPIYQRVIDSLPPKPPVKGKENKVSATPLKCGNFTILNEDSLVAPNTSRVIPVQFNATAAKQYEEVILFIVNDTCPAEASGVPLKLVGNGAIPSLDIWNLETTFREHLILKNISDYKVSETSPHCVFIEDSVTLHFFCITVQSSYTAAIDLYNNGLVASALTMKLHYQMNTDSTIFYLDKDSAYIEPLVHRTLGIVFAPKALMEYRAVLEIRLKLLSNQEQSYKICLIGEGVIPRIEMIEPVMKEVKTVFMQFPVTILNSICCKPIKFKNISSVKSTVEMNVIQNASEESPPYCLGAHKSSEQMLQAWDSNSAAVGVKLVLNPQEIATINAYLRPLTAGKKHADIKIKVLDNAYESFTVQCEAEAFIEDVTLVGFEMLPLDYELDIQSADNDKRKTKSAASDPKKSKVVKPKPKKGGSVGSFRMSQGEIVKGPLEPAFLKYSLDLGGCELNLLQRRTAVMVNHSEKVYKFTWQVIDTVVIKPCTGYISPGEEKDVEICFLSDEPVFIQKENLHCCLIALTPEAFSMETNGSTWDNRQTITVFEPSRDVDGHERTETPVLQPPIQLELDTCIINIYIMFSALVDYTRYSCSLVDDVTLNDTLMYQSRSFEFEVKNIGLVPMKISWSFHIDEEYPARIDKVQLEDAKDNNLSDDNDRGDFSKSEEVPVENETAKNLSLLTLFSKSENRDSADTWFEVELPFTITPAKECLKANESRIFKVNFSPVDAFNYKIRLNSFIENLDPEDLCVTVRILAKSIVPYCHFDIEESDYVSAGRRKPALAALPPDVKILEFNVLGAGCYKKKFNIINPTNESYEFIFEMVIIDTNEVIPIHCNMLKGFIEGGTTTEICFTFSPDEPGVYESQWKFIIDSYSLVVNFLVVGIVREPDVMFIPTILIMKNSLVGVSTTDIVKLRNAENECIKFVFKGNSLCNETGKTPVIVEPEQGVLKPQSEVEIKVIYTPIENGAISFKIFCKITYMVKPLTLCVNALSNLIKPKVLYYLVGNEHTLLSEAITNIHIDEVASTYERLIPFVIKNEGSKTFYFRWHYMNTPVKKFMDINIEPISGHLIPGSEIKCVMSIIIRDVPVSSYPVSLTISDGPEYTMYLHAEIVKPLYTFSFNDYDFGKCVVNAPDSTYKKDIVFKNNDKVAVTIDLDFVNLPEIFVDFQTKLSLVQPKASLKISVIFRPQFNKEYTFKLLFWVNSLCEEIITIKGEGVPLLFDLYEGCEKTIDLGAVKVGEKVIKEVEVINHSKVPIEAHFLFADTYPVIEDGLSDSQATSVCLSPSNTAVKPPVRSPLPDNTQSRVKMLQSDRDTKTKDQQLSDIENALTSLKVLPNKVTINPHQKVPIRIQYKPLGLIRSLNMQLKMKVFEFVRPVLHLFGSATGMDLCFSQNSLQFGKVRKFGCKSLRMMLLNKGDFGAKFWWQPLQSDVFSIIPMEGIIAAQASVTFTIFFKPTFNNPFLKVWAICNIENYKSLELALYGSCLDTDNFQTKTLQFMCPVREVETTNITINNPSDDVWHILSYLSGSAFETWKEFTVEPNTEINVPIIFKPKTMGQHEGQVLFSPLGESSLNFMLSGTADDPKPNGVFEIDVPCKDTFTQNLSVYNLTEFPETYDVQTEILKIVPDKFSGFYEMKFPKLIKVWGEAAATCRWTFVCYEECVMNLRVVFINQNTREYQFYYVIATVKPSAIVDTIKMVVRARESVHHQVIVKNPLSKDVPFLVACNNEEVTFEEQIVVNRKSELPITITYSPLVTGVFEDFLQVGNPLIGVYLYKLILTCEPAKEKNYEITAPLGSTNPMRLRVHNKTEKNADFTCLINHPSLIAEKSYQLGPQEKGKFLVWFEPTDIGMQYGKVFFNSPIAGDFVFNINGTSTEPKPQGPYEIKIGGSTAIRFKNIFEETRTFKIFVDQENFYVKSMFETLKPKQDIKIAVFLSKPLKECEGPMPTGSLTIECHEPLESGVAWTYFLQGTL